MESQRSTLTSTDQTLGYANASFQSDFNANEIIGSKSEKADLEAVYADEKVESHDLNGSRESLKKSGGNYNKMLNRVNSVNETNFTSSGEDLKKVRPGAEFVYVNVNALKKNRSAANISDILLEDANSDIELTSYKRNNKSLDVISEGKHGTLFNNLLKKTNKPEKKKKPRFTLVNNLLRQFILLIVGLPILESEHFHVNFDNEEYQRELSQKSFLVRVLNKRPILSVILFIITLSTGILYAVSTFWYVVENEIDPAIKNNLLKDLLSVITSLIWVSLGTFSISVLYNIFCSADMKDAITNDTKSYFKIPAWFILLLLVCGFIYCATDNMDLAKCLAKDKNDILMTYVCQLKYYSSIIYLFIGCFWNYLVAIIIMMISKTHTKLIRMFLTNIELDNLNIFHVSDIMFDKSNKAMFDDIDLGTEILTPSGSATPNRTLNETDCETPILIEEFDIEASIVNHANQIRRRFDSKPSMQPSKVHRLLNELQRTKQAGIGSNYIEGHLKRNRIKLENCLAHSSPETCPACLYRFSSQNSVRNYARVFCVHIMHPNEILQYFSKILYILRLTSSLTQRWTVAYVTCTLVWCVQKLIGWIDEKPSFTNVFAFISPLLILAVVCGIFAETNAEGKKLVRSISPLDERINMIAYIQLNPLEMTLYGFVLDYKVEVQVIGAFAIGFISQIILHELAL